MSFDFYSTYAGHSNVQLLAIVLQKELYDEAAVQAASAILNTRIVTEEDKAAAEAVVLQLAHQEQRKIGTKRRTGESGELHDPRHFLSGWKTSHLVFESVQCGLFCIVDLSYD